MRERNGWPVIELGLLNAGKTLIQSSLKTITSADCETCLSPFQPNGFSSVVFCTIM